MTKPTPCSSTNWVSVCVISFGLVLCGASSSWNQQPVYVLSKQVTDSQSRVVAGAT